MRWRALLGMTLAVVVVGFTSVLAATEHEGGGDTSPVIAVLLALAMIILAAKMAAIHGPLAQPEVFGELIVGIILGNLSLLGIHTFDFLRRGRVGDLSELGVILLLFEVGLHTTIPDMLRSEDRPFSLRS